jgi:hypothetical protein
MLKHLKYLKGISHLFRRFLEKEYSSENLRFYDLCNELRYATNKDVSRMVVEIYKYIFLSLSLSLSLSPC